MSPSDIDPLELASKRPDWCAKVPLTRGQKLLLTLFALLLVACAVVRPFATARAFVLVSSVFYLALTLYKLWIIRSSARKDAVYRFTPEELAAPRDWPVFSILVPMYKEPEVIPQMVRGLMDMDYPTDRMDVQLLLEEDDEATLAAARATPMPPSFRVTVVPPSFPRTKPKACNIGLGLARGEYLVIYDAEDRPEPDQLRKAVLAFEAAGPKVACVQSCLNFYNPRQNLLTRFFTGDYSSWFDLQLPGLAARKAVIPLGGTSNHFRTAILRDLLGWDAYNVTEDCDLGVRLCRAGYTTAMVDTTTWEEACSSVPFWIRQRTRWIKGYIQTWFVHMRRPFRLLRDLGPRNFLHFQMLVGGGTLAALLNPVFWTLALLWFLVHPAGLDRLFPGPVFAIGAFCLFAGNFLFVYTILLGCYRRSQDRLLWANLLAPLYWVLMSVAGWRAFFQFFRNPFLWEKTQHALGKPQSPKVRKPESPKAPAPAPAQGSASAAPAAPAPAQGLAPAAPAAPPRQPVLARIVRILLFSIIGFLVLSLFCFVDYASQPFFQAVREQVAAGSTCGRQALIGSAWWAPLPLLLGALSDGLGLLLPGILACATVVFGILWLVRGRLNALIPLAFLLASTLLCGIRAWGFTAIGAVLLLLGILMRRRRLLRLPATLLLGVLPTVYSFLVWMLLNTLILQDPLYFLRPAASLTKADIPVLFLGRLPDSRPANPRHVLDDALAVARARSPYARIFLCGYEGLELLGRYKPPRAITENPENRIPNPEIPECSPPDFGLRTSDSQTHRLSDSPITPVLDLHIESLRKAYHGQVHFILVKDSEGAGRFESHTIRNPGLYEFGAPGTILSGDFGPWRLYELIATDGL